MFWGEDDFVVWYEVCLYKCAKHEPPHLSKAMIHWYCKKTSFTKESIHMSWSKCDASQFPNHFFISSIHMKLKTLRDLALRPKLVNLDLGYPKEIRKEKLSFSTEKLSKIPSYEDEISSIGYITENTNKSLLWKQIYKHNARWREIMRDAKGTDEQRNG